MKKTLSVMAAVSLLALVTAGAASAATLVYSGNDYNDANGGPSANGVPYEWQVTLGQTDQANWSFIVGARSWYDPVVFPTPPAQSWTHNSSWVALNLTAPALVTITVGPAAPTNCTGLAQPASCGAVNSTITGGDLYAGFSLYSGQDTTSCQDHHYNRFGPSSWCGVPNTPTIVYVGSAPARAANPNKATNPDGRATYKVRLAAGAYTLAIGGNAYNSCSTGITSECQTGGKSYEAVITTTP
jgi:hypothetical protein